MLQEVQEEVDKLKMGSKGKLIIGNWFDRRKPLDKLLETEGKQYDTVLADYLIGAIDGFSPFKQDLIIPKLTRLLKPGGRLYIVGLEPIPDEAPGDANIICQVRRARDAAILLGGKRRCYREYPGTWVSRQIKENNPDLKLVKIKIFPIHYRHEQIVRQINVARHDLPNFPTPELANQMRLHLDQLEAQSLEATERRGTIRLGNDYVIAAEKEGSIVEEGNLEQEL